MNEFTCVNEFSNCDMRINASKCAVLRIGPRFSKHCADICIQGLPVAYCDKTKYLGVMLRSSVKLSVDLSYTKTKFYRAFNSLFDKSSKFKDELVILQLNSAYCKPHLLYARECTGTSVTQMRSLKNTMAMCRFSCISWYWCCCTVYLFCHWQFIFGCAIIDKCIRFLEHLKLNSHHDILFTSYMQVGLQELSRLRDIKLHACAE